MNGARNGTLFSAPPSGALCRDQKVKYHYISITKSISKIFKQNFACLLTNERYNTYQTRFSFGRRGYAPGLGLRGTVFSEIHPDLVCELHECNGTIFWGPAPLGLGEGPKGQISLNLNYKVNFKDF